VLCQRTQGQESWLTLLSAFTSDLLSTKNFMGYSRGESVAKKG